MCSACVYAMLTEELLDFASCPILRFLQKAGEIAEPFCSTENFCRYFKRFGYISYGSTTLWHVIRVIQWLQGVCIFSGEYSGSLRLCRVSILFVSCGLDGEAMCFVFDCCAVRHLIHAGKRSFICHCCRAPPPMQVSHKPK